MVAGGRQLGDAAAAAAGKAGAAELAHPDAIAILGGTFDPPHNGHLALACGVADALGLQRVWLMPAGNPHFKLDQDVSSAKHRMAMTRLLAACDSRLEASSIEVERQGVTYTADTLTQLHERYPAAKLFFIIGGDSAQHIWRWRRAEQIAQLCTVVAVARQGYDFARGQAAIEQSGMGFDVRYLHLDVPDVSSTQVRAKVAAGEPLAGLVPPAIERYITDHGLYRSHP